MYNVFLGLCYSDSCEQEPSAAKQQFGNNNVGCSQCTARTMLEEHCYVMNWYYIFFPFSSIDWVRCEKISPWSVSEDMVLGEVVPVCDWCTTGMMDS